jgi:hypothetical protein
LLTLSELATVLMALAVVQLLLRSVKTQRGLALDAKQAQEVRQVILPQARVVHRGLMIKSVYRPARQVGGDFFQILPHDTDGSLLIVAGDVAGKGLQAGGLAGGGDSHGARKQRRPRGRAWRSKPAADGTQPGRHHLPGAAYYRLWRRYTGHAGHLPPYLNGRPVATEGALPLRIFASAKPSVMRFTLEH